MAEDVGLKISAASGGVTRPAPAGWHPRLTREVVDAYEASGQWTNVTLADRASALAVTSPNVPAIIDGETVLTFAEIHEQALRLAFALKRRGLIPGDVLSFQLPNWFETAIINLAASLAGLIVNPIVPIYRDAEVSFILEDARSSAIFIPGTYRNFDYPELIARIRNKLPRLKHIITTRERRNGLEALDDLLAERTEELPAHLGRPDPNSIKLLLYTSGTTGLPKGVLHSHNTLGAEIDANVRFRSLVPQDVVFMPSPVTHVTGYLYGLELPFAAGMTAVLMDRWDASAAVELMERYCVTFSVGATPFLVELVDRLAVAGRSLTHLRRFGCGGSPVPPQVVERAAAVLPNCVTSRAYGCSEAPTITMGLKDGDPPELAATTDGVIYNNEVRVVDLVTGETCAPGRPGEILARGPEVMVGYSDPAHNLDAFDDDGFFRTGDIGFLSHGTYLTISGRRKDIIIRGGENLSPKEIEDVLHRHSAIREAAVVAMPHARMGETPCAFVVLRDGTSLGFDEMTAFLANAGLAKQKFPERLILVADLPHNAAGKVLKQALRDQL